MSSLPRRFVFFRHRVIYAPAAFLGSGSHFSGSLSGIKPSSPVTRQLHGWPLSNHQHDRSIISLVYRSLFKRFAFYKTPIVFNSFNIQLNFAYQWKKYNHRSILYLFSLLQILIQFIHQIKILLNQFKINQSSISINQ